MRTRRKLTSFQRSDPDHFNGESLQKLKGFSWDVTKLAASATLILFGLNLADRLEQRHERKKRRRKR